MSRRKKGPKLPTPQQSGLPQQMNVDLSEAYNVLCNKCGNFAFIPAVTFKKLLALMSPTGKEGVVPVETFMCTNCGYIPPEFLPVPIRVPDPRSEGAEEEGGPFGIPGPDSVSDVQVTNPEAETVSDGGIIVSTKL